ncbi:MAG: hypothetical protein WBC33_04040 [Conexibacter sp.]
MSVIRELTQTIRSGERSAPKTVLAFYGVVAGIIAGASIAAIAVLARQPELRYLVAPILIFDAVLVVLLLIGVFVVSLIDPTRLMLGQITGRDYIENRRLTMGDSRSGEHMTMFLEPIDDAEPALAAQATDRMDAARDVIEGQPS